jgi:hypothetical protein
MISSFAFSTLAPSCAPKRRPFPFHRKVSFFPPSRFEIVSDFGFRIFISAALLCYALVISAPAASEIQLPPVFGHNMVLQRNAVNLLWGKTTAREYVQVLYKDLHFEARADAAGWWHAELDTSALASDKPASLEFQTGRKKTRETSVILTNVVVGDLLLVGTVGRGVAPQPGTFEQTRAQLDEFRYTTLPELGALQNHCSPEIKAWRVCSRDPATVEDLSVLSFAWAIQVGKGYTGAIQTKADELAAVFKASTGHVPAKDAQREARFRALWEYRDLVNTLATNEVCSVLARRNQLLVEFKHAGIVTNLPSPVQFDFPNVRLREEFDRKRVPASLLTFDSAVW